jgi:hypothetical protein
MKLNPPTREPFLGSPQESIVPTFAAGISVPVEALKALALGRTKVGREKSGHQPLVRMLHTDVSRVSNP